MIERLGHTDRRTYKTVIYETLHELIQDLALPPGARLVEADLAARFGISKTPVREALLMLEQENLVTIVAHVGATVTALSIEDYEQQIFLQDALEQPALPRVVQCITPAELAVLDTLIDRIVRAHTLRDARLYHQLVRRMHADLFSAARYPRLMDHIGMVMQALRRYHPLFVQPFAENWNRELAIITQRFAHVRAGNPAAATAVVQQGHVEMLAFARRRVEARDPAVWRYLSINTEPGIDQRFSLHKGV
jgi:DNA-binding GntR family transcriptional regulator